MNELASSSYDELPYTSRPMAPTHPDNLATVAWLHGLDAPDPRHCRVLELGCADGGNLIAMAQTLPDSSFLGIDASPRQIESGQAVLQQVNLPQVELRAQSILDITPDWGLFDYIVCHGVFSWVTAAIQDKILSICATNLAPRGVAYVSYNTYPGWHLRGAVREMLRFHASQFRDAQTRVREARDLLEFLARSTTDKDSTYRRLLQDELARLPPESDSYLFHEHLEDENRPLYFHEFQRRAESFGLQYLDEARPSPQAANLPRTVREKLARYTQDAGKREQYLDFVTNRTFRRSLICHFDERLSRGPSPDALAQLRLTARVASQSPELVPASGDTEKFSGTDGATLSTNEPVLKIALRLLKEQWPRAVPFESLCQQVLTHWQRSGQIIDVAEQRQKLLSSILHCCLSNLVELRRHESPGVWELTARPIASPLARWQAAADVPIANLRHRVVDITSFERLVLAQLDGSRDRNGLLNYLAQQVTEGTLGIDLEGHSVQDAATVRAILRDALEDSLVRLAGYSLLIG